MIRLNYDIVNELVEYDEIVGLKRPLTARTRLVNLRAGVGPHFENYLVEFAGITGLAANPFGEQESDDLRKCYDNPTAALENLKKRLIESQSDEFKILCPYCMIVNHGTFDHYIPKEEHPVFSVLPKNMVPCCDPCNRRKLQYWKAEGQRAIIHFYNDLGVEERFLQCDLSINNGIPELIFRLDFDGNTPQPLRFRLEKHFERLGLLSRYKKASTSLISNVRIDIKSLGVLTTNEAEVIAVLSQKATEFFQKYGNNYWFALGYEAIADSPPVVEVLLA